MSPHTSREPKRPVVRTVAVDPDRSSPAERDALVDRLYAVFEELFSGTDRASFRDSILLPEHDLLRVAELFGPDGELAGFANWYCRRTTHGGRHLVVHRSSVFSRLGYSGGAAARRFMLASYLRSVARYPRGSHYYLTLAATPMSYRFAARMVATVFPRPQADGAVEARELAATLAATCGIATVRGNPWVVPLAADPVDRDRLRSSRLYDADPDVRFYRELLAPHGQGHVVLCVAPCTLRNSASAVLRVARDRLGAALARLRPMVSAPTLEPRQS